MFVEPADGVRLFGEGEIEVAKQRHVVGADKLGNHVVWFVDDKVAVVVYRHGPFCRTNVQVFYHWQGVSASNPSKPLIKNTKYRSYINIFALRRKWATFRLSYNSPVRILKPAR